MGAVIWLYVPAIIFGQVFSLFWLLSALILQTNKVRKPAVQAGRQINECSKGESSPVTLSFVNLSCTFQDAARQTVAALRGATGLARPAEILAVLGPSGAGKSTLMDVLALRRVSGQVSGSILVNGAPVSMDFLKRSAYVPQVCALLQVCRHGLIKVDANI